MSDHPLPAHGLYLIDASIYLFRAWFSYPPEMTNGEGRPVNAVYGYANFLCQLLERARPEHLAAAFDLSLTTSFRNDIYPPYKGNRELPPPELEWQMTIARDLTEAMGVAVHASEVYEADDLIGTLATSMRKEGFPAVIVSADKDLAQLLDDGDVLWDFARDRREDGAAVAERMGIRPRQVADFLALTGDKVDNIPGVPGIGPKTAAALLSHFDSLDGLFDRLDEIAARPIRGAKGIGAKLRDHEGQIRLARRLTGIHTAAPVHAAPQDLRWKRPNSDGLNEIFDQLGFGRGLRERCLQLA
ncbi:MAG: flap endonuclease [Chromatiales bacterium]|nr:flap endonuclease [Chromatiales bacterium]